MIDKLKAFKERFLEISEQIIKPEVISDNKKYLF